MAFVYQHQVVLAEVAHGDALHALPLGQLVQVDNLDRRQQVRPGLAQKQPDGEITRQQFAFVLRRHLFVRRHQDDVVERFASGAR